MHELELRHVTISSMSGATSGAGGRGVGNLSRGGVDDVVLYVSVLSRRGTAATHALDQSLVELPNQPPGDGCAACDRSPLDPEPWAEIVNIQAVILWDISDEHVKDGCAFGVWYSPTPPVDTSAARTRPSPTHRGAAPTP